MNFTDPIPFKCAEYSNHGFFLAISKLNELTIFDSDNFTRVQNFIMPEVITQVQWSPDDKFIMVLLGKTQEIHLRCFDSSIVENQSEGWMGAINDKVGGIEAAYWAPDSRQILTYASNLLRVSIWSLVSEGLQGYISNPKMLPPKGIAYTENRKFTALLERKDAKDVVGIYYAGNDWKMINRLAIDTQDAQDIKWISGDACLLVWDTALESKIFIYSAATGELLTRHEPECVGLGLKTLTVSPNQNLMAGGLYDGSIVLYNNLTGVEIASLQHFPKIDLNQKSAKTIFVYHEESSQAYGKIQGNASYQYVCYQNLQDEASQEKQEIIKIPQLSKKEIEGFKNSKFENVGTSGPPTGVQKIEWSYTTHYLASRCDQMPSAVWIWDMTTLELASVLIHLNPVKSFKFSPSSNDLYIVTGSGRVYTWAPQGASVIELPHGGFGNEAMNRSCLSKIKWNPNSSNLLLMDKNELLIGIPPKPMDGPQY